MASVINFSKIQKYIDCFQIENSENSVKYICDIESCGCSYSDKSGAIRHLKKIHKDVYHNVSENKKKTKEDKSKMDLDFEIRARVNPKDIVRACVELIAMNSLPISIVESAAFKKLLQPYVTALGLKGINLVINRRNIIKHIAKSAESIKDAIKSEIQCKYLCLMIDIASRLNRSVLGVNVAFMKDSKVRIYTIGMHALRKSHTAENLRDIIKDNLNDFDVSLNQILSITTDNGANLLKTIALLDADLQNEINDGNENMTDDVSEIIYGSSFCDFDSDLETENETFDEQYFGDLLTAVRNQFSSLVYSHLIHGVSCAAHCLHLIVTKAVSSSLEVALLLEKCRDLAKKLRTPTLRNMLKDLKLKQAVLDVVTRWNSTYLMLKRLLELRSFCDSLIAETKMAEFLLSETEWRSVEQILVTLKPFYVYSTRLQSESTTLSDFYGFWTRIAIKMKKLPDSELRQRILNEMDKREKLLLENPLVVAGVFLDPRYQRLLNDDQKELAVFFLNGVFQKLGSLENRENRTSEDVNNTIDNNADDSGSDSGEEMTAYLNSIHNPNSSSSNQPAETTTQTLLKFIGVSESVKKPIMEYWEERKSEDALYKLSQIIHAIPPTQTTVERSFSALSLILTPLRSRISDINLKNILLIRLNGSMLDKIKIIDEEIV